MKLEPKIALIIRDGDGEKVLKRTKKDVPPEGMLPNRVKTDDLKEVDICCELTNLQSLGA